MITELRPPAVTQPSAEPSLRIQTAWAGAVATGQVPLGGRTTVIAVGSLLNFRVDVQLDGPEQPVTPSDEPRLPVVIPVLINLLVNGGVGGICSSD